jgi:sugar phosphate permease
MYVLKKKQKENKNKQTKSKQTNKKFFFFFKNILYNSLVLYLTKKWLNP